MEEQDPTKVRLIDAAGEEFADKGFDATRIRTICDRAGANVAAVNYHFGDKEQLYVETVLDAHRCSMELGEYDAAVAAGPAEQLRSFIHHFLTRVLAINHPQDWRHRLMLREMLQPTSASDVLVRESIRPHFEQLQQVMRQFCPEADERKLNALTFSVIGQCLHYKMARPVTERLIGPEGFGALDLEFLTDHITSFCLAALGSIPPLNQAGLAATAGAVANV
ncbi:MAG TPA: CerR family C-terminal domain-containing protein [Isosphaeraceae bacterium]|nr:CerR family C-terminal domain-containing protein [Isosphaeraceae bacterium]